MWDRHHSEKGCSSDSSKPHSAEKNFTACFKSFPLQSLDDVYKLILILCCVLVNDHTDNKDVDGDDDQDDVNEWKQVKGRKW